MNHYSRTHTKYFHHGGRGVVVYIREIVFGLQDGMVSTLGSLTGIAVGSQNRFTVLLAGLVIIAVESISMAIGSYSSSLSEKELDDRIVAEEKEQIAIDPKDERRELFEMYLRDGWSRDAARMMVREAAGNKKLMLKEMSYRELHIAPDRIAQPIINGVFMFFAYTIGGFIPLAPYFLVPVAAAPYYSTGIACAGLFVLGAVTARLVRQNWLRAGIRMLILGASALFVGYLIGAIANTMVR